MWFRSFAICKYGDRQQPSAPPARMAVATADSCTAQAPYWNYGDLGLFLLLLSGLTLGLRLLARWHLIEQDQLSNPGDTLQMLIVLSLIASFYGLLRLRCGRPVSAPLGWVWPKLGPSLASLASGLMLGTTVALYQHLRSLGGALYPSLSLLVLVSLLAPVLEESLFRGCLLPLIASTAGNTVAITLTAGMFALFHGPTDVAHCLSFFLAGIVYGSIRAASGTTTTACALAHSGYNLVLFAATLV